MLGVASSSLRPGWGRDEVWVMRCQEWASGLYSHQPRHLCSLPISLVQVGILRNKPVCLASVLRNKWFFVSRSQFVLSCPTLPAIMCSKEIFNISMMWFKESHDICAAVLAGHGTRGRRTWFQGGSMDRQVKSQEGRELTSRDTSYFVIALHIRINTSRPPQF